MNLEEALQTIVNLEADVAGKKRILRVQWFVVGDAIKAAREAKKLPLRQLGAMLALPGHPPVSAAFLSYIENARRYPSPEMRKRILEVLS